MNRARLIAWSAVAAFAAIAVLALVVEAQQTAYLRVDNPFALAPVMVPKYTRVDAGVLSPANTAWGGEGRIAGNAITHCMLYNTGDGGWQDICPVGTGSSSTLWERNDAGTLYPKADAGAGPVQVGTSGTGSALSLINAVKSGTGANTGYFGCENRSQSATAGKGCDYSFRMEDGSGNHVEQARISSTLDATATTPNTTLFTSSALQFLTRGGSTPTTLSEWMRLTSTGRFGLGTTTPGELGTLIDTLNTIKADVYASTNAFHALRVFNNSTGSSAGAFLYAQSESAAGEIGAFPTAAAGTFAGVSRGDSVIFRSTQVLPGSKMFVGTGTSSPLYIMTNDTLSMTVDTSQHVGVNTLTPGALGTAIDAAATIWFDVVSGADISHSARVYDSNSGTSSAANQFIQSNSAALGISAFSSTYAGTIAGVALADAVIVRSTSAVPATNFLIGTGSSAPLYLITNDIVGLSISTGQVVNIPGLTASKGVFTDVSSNLTSTGTLGVAQGGTSLATLTAHALYVGNGASAPTALAIGATGDCLNGNTGADPSWGSCSSGAVTSVTGTTNQITASPTTGDVILTLPAVVVAPGSLASTTDLKAGTTLTLNSGTGTTVKVAHGGSPASWSQVSLTADVTGNLPVTNLDSGTGAGATTYWSGAGTWTTPAGTGVTGSGASPRVAVWSGASALTSDVNFTWASQALTVITPAAGTTAVITHTNNDTGGRSYSSYSSANANAVGGGNFVLATDNTSGGARLMVTSSGHLVPAITNGTLDIGSATAQWRTAYLGTSAIVAATTTLASNSLNSTGSFSFNTTNNQTITTGTGLLTAGGALTAIGILTAASDIQFSVAGKHIFSKESGAGADCSGAAVLVGGAVTVSTTCVPATTANSRILLTSQIDGGTPGWLRVSAKTASTSFSITSSSVLDTSTVAWWIVEKI